MVCAWRALEHLLPPARRIVDDPYARAFLLPPRDAVIDAAARLPPRLLSGLARRVDRLLAGSMTFVLARHRAMDEALAAEVRAGVLQVVLLGAGYDSRSARLVDALAGATVFEVDHPATSARKQARVAEALAGVPRAETVAVPVDFQRDSFAERLVEAGFRTGERTFWIWEGVTMYLPEPAVRETLQRIRSLSPAGSRLVFDVWGPPADGARGLVLRDLPALFMGLVYAEPFTGPYPAETLRPLLESEGFAVRELVGRRALLERYERSRLRLRLPELSYLHLCTAEVT